MLWSVSVVASGDREMTREEIVELADAVATSGGIATGIGTPSYGAQLVVDAPTAEAAVATAVAELAAAASRAGLPAWPIEAVGIVGEDDEEVELG